VADRAGHRRGADRAQQQRARAAAAGDAGDRQEPLPGVDDEVPVDPKRLEDYKGEYRISKTKALGFTVRNGRLLVRETGRGYNALTPTGTDRFAVATIGAQIVFQRAMRWWA
jgi:hypothetical protein